MVSKPTPVSSMPTDRSTIMSYFRFWPIFSTVGSSKIGFRVASVDAASRHGSPSGARSGRYHASRSFQAKDMPTSFAQRGQTLVVSVSSEKDFCWRRCVRKASNASGVSTRWAMKGIGDAGREAGGEEG